LLEHRLLIGKAFVVAVLQIHRADLGTFTAAGAFGHIDVFGVFADIRREPTRLSGKLLKLAVGDKLYV